MIAVMLAAIAGPELTARQREAVAQRGGNVLVEAVPGAGKTRVLVARCEALLAAGVPASAIVLLTFSRRAVGELRARLAPVLAQDRFPDIHTFHGFAARLLAQPDRLNVVAVGLLEDGEDDRLAEVVESWAGAGGRS